MTNNFNNIVLNEKGVKDVKKNAKKKKGFTLIELIAVIAILGILAAVIVPKVGSYTTSANSAKLKANASTVLNAIETYNAAAADSKKITTTTGTDLFTNPTVSTLKGASVDASTNTDTTKLDTTAGQALLDTLTRLDTTNDSTLLAKKYSELPALVH